jgi:tRNA splicing ligase
MSTPLVVDFLRSGGTLADLAARYFIKATRHRQKPHLVLLKYDQINSPFAEPIVRECRGIILDEASNWRVVSRSFDKFFNHGEGHAATIDWSTARVYRRRSTAP